MRRPVLLCVIAAAAALPGCATREPSDQEQVRDTLAAFARAVEGREYGRLCEEILAPDLLDGIQRIGLPCEVAMRNSLSEVRTPRLAVGAVEVKGERATAEVRTSAQGQPPSRDTVTLVKTEAGWRVSDLGGGSEPDPGATPEPEDEHSEPHPEESPAPTGPPGSRAPEGDPEAGSSPDPLR